jgi:hypothetical protein
MADEVRIEELIGEDLGGFEIVEMTEVYRVDYDGKQSNSLGFFKSQNTAAVFAESQTDASWHKTRKAPVLTNGILGFVIENHKLVKLLDDKAEALELKKKVAAKLSPAERMLLGLE